MSPSLLGNEGIQESCYWLRLLDTGEGKSLEAERTKLVGEATELMKIVAAIMYKSQ